MRIRRPAIAAVLTASVCIVAAALSSNSSLAQDTADDAGGLFRANCAFCHGTNGKGAVTIAGLPNFTDNKFQAARSNERLIASITNGRNEMPAFGDVLKPQEIRQLVEYVRHFSPAYAQKNEEPAVQQTRARYVITSDMSRQSEGNGLLEKALNGAAHIYDLTHIISSKTPTFDGTKDQYEDQKQADVEKNGYALGIVRIPEHFGTHVDAPAHFVAGMPTIDELDPRNLIARAVVIDVRDKVKDNADYRLEPADIKAWIAANGPIPDRAVVLMLTGWGERFDAPERYRNSDSKGFLHFPGYSVDAIKYLLKNTKIVGIGIDTLSIDPGTARDFAAHKVALKAGLYHIENAANLDKLPARGAVLFVGPLPFKGGSGSPARVLAIAPE